MHGTRSVVTWMLLFGGMGVMSCKSSPPRNQNASNVEDDTRLLVVSGDKQSGKVATELPNPIVVQVLKNKRPLSGQVVNFVVTTASDQLPSAPSADAGIPSIADTTFKGVVFAGTAITDSNGRAQDYWTLGAKTSYAQNLEIRATDMISGKVVFNKVTATALPGPETFIGIPMPPKAGPPLDAGAGNPGGGSGRALLKTVIVQDIFQNPVGNVSVTFRVTAGNGSVSPQTVATGSDGIAQTTWTLGTRPNTYNSLAATAPGVSGGITWNDYVGCSAGTACTMGNGVCVDTQHDSNNCNWCGYQCPAPLACMNGTCQCPGGNVNDAGSSSLILCKTATSNVCTDLQSDPNHCGNCDRRCANAPCVNGNCQCPGAADAGIGLSLCSNTQGEQLCVDLQTDSNNCGWCGLQCRFGTSCVNGTCQCQGAGVNGNPLHLCQVYPASQACVDLQTDNSNCGGCSNHCPSGTSCVNGLCQCSGGGVDGGTVNLCTTPSGDPVCVNVQTDINHCGWCGNRCPSQGVCSGGSCQCTVSNPTSCGTSTGSICTDVQSDSSNCGFCGRQCPGTTTCVAGYCRCADGNAACETASGLSCTDLQNDVNNCGGCGARCPTGPDWLCREARCQYCPSNTIYCASRHECVNPANDVLNCGGCGITCKRNGYCSLGQCSCAGLTDCSTHCADTLYDPDNCGGCDAKCPSGQRHCSSGGCLSCKTIGPGYDECDGKCTDLRFDPSNCGNCGSACRSNSACVNGLCIPGQ